jgi:hypothetical protein
MPLIRQIIKGKTVRSLDVVASDADVAPLIALLAGQVDTYELESTAGTAGTLPALLNAKKFSVRSNDGISCSVSIPHVKTSVQKNDMTAVVVGAFDAHWDLSTKADKMNLFYDSSKA